MHEHQHEHEHDGFLPTACTVCPHGPVPSCTMIQLFSSPDTDDTESTRATGAAGILLLLSIIYCLGYPVVKAFRRAKGDETGAAQEQRSARSSTAIVAASDYVA